MSFSKPMKRLVLMRHAKTEPWDHGIEDAGRVLMPSGQRDAALIAAELAKRNWAPDRVLMSSARRTRETWKYMAERLSPAKTDVLDKLYLAGTQALNEVIRDNTQIGTLMLLGHNPGLHDLAASISSRSGTKNQKAAMTLAAKMPTSATALFEAADDGDFDGSAFKLVDFIVVKTIRHPEI